MIAILREGEPTIFLKPRKSTSYLLTAKDVVQPGLRTDALNGMKCLETENDQLKS